MKRASQKLRIFNPNDISMLEIEALIDRGYRFDIYDGLDEQDYDNVKEVLYGEDEVRSDLLPETNDNI